MDPHERFAEWLAAGAEGDPPRDAALHASMCEDCMRAVAAFDSLQAIDPGAAPLPPLRALAPERATPLGAARIAVGAFAVILLAASVSIGASGLLRQTESAAEASSTPGGEVLGGAPSPRSTQRLPSPTPTASATARSSASPSATEATAAAFNATLAPTQAPPPQTAPPPPSTAEPTLAPTATPALTPAPSPTPPPPTPTPNANPVAVDDSYTAIAGVATSGNVLVNDSDPDGDALTVAAWGAPSSGAFLSTSPDGTFSFLADATFEGIVTFSYTVDDGHGGSDVGTATIQVSLPLP